MKNKITLTKEQILQIDSYILCCGIHWIDVRVELIDHFANSIENKLEENPLLDFKQEIVNEHKNFSNNGFKELLESKKKTVEKHYYRQVFKHMKSFFKLPKIIISMSLFIGLVTIMDLFSNKELFFEILTIVLFAIVLQCLIRILVFKRIKKENFLMLNKTELFFQVVYVLMLIFSNLNSSNKRNF